MLDEYNEFRTYIKFLFGSDVRLKVLLALINGPMELSELRSIIKSSSSTILHAIYQLEEKNLVSRINRSYELSSTGRIVSLKILGVIRTLSVISRFSEFFLDHDIHSIPDSLLGNIDSIHGASLLKARPEDLTAPYDRIREKVLNSERVWILSGVCYPFYEDIIKMGIPAEIILSEDIADSVESDASDSVKIRAISRDLNFSLIITDDSMALGLFMSDGLYDPGRFIFSEDEDAIDWAWRLFKHFTGTGDE